MKRRGGEEEEGRRREVGEEGKKGPLGARNRRGEERIKIEEEMKVNSLETGGISHSPFISSSLFKESKKFPGRERKRRVK